jgi:beta-lactamase class A
MRRPVISFAALRGALLVAVAALAPAGGVYGQDVHLEILGRRLQQQLDSIAHGTPGVFGVQVIDLSSGQRFGTNDELVFPQGSAIKVPILVELFRQADRGELRLDEAVTIRRDDAVGGSGYLRHFRDGASALSLHDLAVMMITISDNMATNLLIERVGMENVTRTMAGLGLPNTKLQRRMIQPEESRRGNENLSTATEAATLMARIHRCELPMSETLCRELRDILEIPHAGAIADAVPAGITVGQKTGSITGVAVNWGYVDLPGRPYVIAAMGNYGDTGRIQQSIRAATAAAHDYFRRLQNATMHGTRVR